MLSRVRSRTRCPRTSCAGDVVSVRLRRGRQRGGCHRARGLAARRGSRPLRSNASWSRSRRRSSSSRSGSRTTTARRPAARWRSSRRRSARAARNCRNRPSGTRSEASRSPQALTAAQERALARLGRAYDEGGGHFLLYGATGSGKTEVYLQAAADGARPRPRRDRPRPRDRARATDGRPLPGTLRRPRGDPALVAERGRAARRARAHRVRGGADRDRCALGRLRPAAEARPDLRRRGARRRVQAGVRPSLRRAHGGCEARLAGRRRRDLRKRDAAARELGAARADRARRANRRPPSDGAHDRPARRGRLPAVCSAARGARQARRGRGQGDPAAQPPRRRARTPLPRLRRDEALPELRRRARPAPRRGAALPPLRRTGGDTRGLPRVRLRRARANRRRDAAARARAGSPRSRARALPARRRRDREARRAGGDAEALRRRRARGAASARRWSPRGTTSQTSRSRP